MLTPMQTQYLVGLCCLKQNPDAVNITIGDMVMDEAARKERDVDITVTYTESDGTLGAFKAFEVKKESKPLDIIDVEQLCAKLNDMPEITHKAIVSASGFTKPALLKAQNHGVDLFELKPWTTALSDHFKSFQNLGHVKDFMKHQGSYLLCWNNYEFYFTVIGAGNNFNWNFSDKAFTSKGTVHEEFENLGEFCNSQLLQSTEILLNIKSVSKLNVESNIDNLVEIPAWPHSHTLDVNHVNLFLNESGKILQISNVTITGNLFWQKKVTIPEYLILENVLTKEVFAGAVITPFGSPDGKMGALIFSPDSNAIGVNFINLNHKQKNIIKNLKIRQQNIV